LTTIVRAGDTCQSLAVAYGITMPALRAANGLDDNCTISLDQQLVIPDPPSTAPPICPVTQPPSPPFVPPITQAPGARTSGFWYGTPGLWTKLGDEGVWRLDRRLFWWREGDTAQAEPNPALLTVSGRRLDVPGALVFDDRASNIMDSELGYAMSAFVSFPQFGCWEISGDYAEETVTFVVWVIS
jgi:LysM repeat protein